MSTDTLELMRFLGNEIKLCKTYNSVREASNLQQVTIEGNVAARVSRKFNRLHDFLLVYY